MASDFGGKVLYDQAKIKDLICESEADAVVLMGAGNLGSIKNYL